MRIVWNMLFGLVLALLLGYGGDTALAQTTFEPYREDVVDGDWRDWGWGASSFDGYQDVTPDANNSIDIRNYDFSIGGGFSREDANGRKVYEPPFSRTDNGRVIDNSRKGHIRDQADSGHAEGGFQATPDTIAVKTEDKGGGVRRISGKLLRSVVGGYAFLWVGILIGSGIDDYRDTCRGWFPSNDQYASEDEKLCIDVAALIGAGTGWTLGIPIGVSMMEPNDRFIHTLGGSLGGFVTCGLFTMVSGGALWPSMIVAPVVFATAASEWSRHAKLSRKPLEARGEKRRFSIGLMPHSEENLAAVVTLRF